MVVRQFRIDIDFVYEFQKIYQPTELEWATLIIIKDYFDKVKTF